MQLTVQIETQMTTVFLEQTQIKANRKDDNSVSTTKKWTAKM